MFCVHMACKEHQVALIWRKHKYISKVDPWSTHGEQVALYLSAVFKHKGLPLNQMCHMTTRMHFAHQILT